MSPLKTLILGGTAEASDLAARVAGDARFEATISLAGVTKTPKQQALPVRIGGFGGADGLAEYLRVNAIQALIDATHPFAAIISANAFAAAAKLGVPYLVVHRPPWTKVAGDQWIAAPTMGAAADELGRTRRRVFLTVGRKDLAPFVSAPQHHYVIRSVDAPPPEMLPPDVLVITARGPFNKSDEAALLDAHRIDVLVTKNSGGSAASAKLAAARARQIPVVMIERPPPPSGQQLGTAAAAFDWLVDQHHKLVSARRGV